MPSGLGPALGERAAAIERSLAITETRLAGIAGAGVVPADAATLARRTLATVAAGGKRLRPLLVFLCGAADESASRPDPALVTAGCAVELVHTAALLHDDVLDRAPLRRGAPTVYAAEGRAAAITTGDFLFARAFAELAAVGDPDAVRTLSAAASALVGGELMQRADAWSPDVGVERYLERCRLKTASLFEASCRLGALLGAPGPGAAAALGRFGEELGVAFQVLDDILDIEGAPGVTGKRRGTDLLDGTVTLPFILARAESSELRALDPRSITDPDEAERVCEIIVATGAGGRARERALAHVERAKAALASIDLPASRRRALDLLAEQVADRQT